jgi:hypothetical protein
LAQRPRERVAQGRVVIDDEYAGHAHRQIS